MGEKHHDSQHLEPALAAVAGAAAATLVSAWLWVGTAALLFGAGWPQLSIATLIGGLGELPSHAGDPRFAFPPTVREQLPGTAGFYAALCVMLLLAAAAATLALQITKRLGVGRGRRARHGARWARSGELRPLRRSVPRVLQRQRTAADARLALGYRGARLLRAEQRHALVVFGPPQSGKSTAIAIPNLLEWDSAAIASSIKSDLLDATLARRRQLGEVMIFDPLRLQGQPGSTWSPLNQAGTWDGALSTALRLASAGEIESRNVKGGDFWSAAAEQRLAPLLYAATRAGKDMRAVVRWAYGQGEAELPGLLHELLEQRGTAAQRADAQAAFDAHSGFAALAGDTRSSVESTVQMLLRGYRSQLVQQSASSCEITGERLLQSANTLYLIGDPHRSKLLRPIFLALLAELVDFAYAKANATEGKRLAAPLLLCLDELGNTAPLANLGEIASSAPSHNIQLISIFHDLAQAKSRYGDQAQTVINSHRARMLLPGVADLETLRYFSGLVGEEEVRERAERSEHRPPPRRRPLAAPEQLRQIEQARALVIYGRLAPTMVRLRMHFKSRRLRRLASAADRRQSDGRRPKRVPA
jgi:type IV secretion system protein VirD4